MVWTINGNGSARWKHGVAIAAAASLLACSGDDGGPVADQNGTVGGRVLLALGGPLVGADVAIDQLDYFAGTPTIRVHEGDTTTDSAGHFELLTGVDSGYFLITARGGQFVDYATGQTVALDPADELKTILYTDPLEDLTTGLVSPVGHLTQALALSRLEAGMHPSIVEAHAFATEHVDRHFGDLPWERMQPADLAARQTSPTAEVRAAFILGAWSLLAADTAAQAGSSVQEINPYTLAIDLGEDLATGPFDGNDDNNRTAGSGIQLGTCPPVDSGCVVPGDVCSLGACRSLCDAYAGSLRATLSAEVTKLINDNDPGGRNQTGLSIADTLAFARTMNLNGDEVLFGAACVETLDRLAPTFLWDAIPAEDAIVRGTISVRVRIIDDTDQAPVVTWAGDLTDTDGAPNVAQAMINTASAADGALMVTANAVDSSGNSESDTLNLIADNTPPTLIVSSSGFVVDGQARWWTADATPEITGTVTDAHGPITVEAIINGQVVASGDYASGAWTLTLNGGVAVGGSTVTIRASDAVDNITADRPETSPSISIDSEPPSLESVARGIFDEQQDNLTYTSNRPQHAHMGTQLPIGGPGTSCPPVYKHAYLLDTAPAGDETQANPLALEWRANDTGIGVNASAFTYSVTAPNGATFGPFPMTGNVAGGVWTVVSTLLRNGPQGIAPLGAVDQTQEGTFTITFRAEDLLGNDETLTKCWTHQPIGAPVQATGSGAIPTGTPAENFDALSIYRLSENDAISPLLNGTHAGAGLMRVDLFNRTNDKVWWTFAPSITMATRTKTWSVKHAVMSTQSANIQCNYDSATEEIYGPPAICTADYTSTLAGETATIPMLFTATPTVRLFDVSTATPVEIVPCATCEPLEFETLPGRPYSAIVAIKNLQPLAFTGISSGYLEGNTGTVPTTRLPIAPLSPAGDGQDKICSDWDVINFGTARCTQITTMGGVRYAQSLGLSIGTVDTGAASAAGSTLAFKYSGDRVLPVPPLNNYTWSTTEAPLP